MTKKFLQHFVSPIFQTFKDNQKANGYAKVFDVKDEAEFEKLNKAGCGIYFTPNGFKGGRKIDNLVKLNAVYADLDLAKEGNGSVTIEEKKPLVKALRDKFDPNFIIDTKNGIQPIWLIDEDKIDKEVQDKYRNVINGIIEWSKTKGAMGDKVKDVTRVLRLPGYYHMKNKPYLCKVFTAHDRKVKLDDLKEKFPYEEDRIEIKYNNNFKRGLVLHEIDMINFQELVVRAFANVGRTASFDKQNRLILDGRLTGTFQGKNGDRNYLASTSHEPFNGNRITVVADILGCTNKEAFSWIKEEYGLKEDKLKTKKLVKEIKEVKPKALDNYYTWGTDELTWNFAPIKRDTYTVLVGETGDGKTTFSYDMAIKNAARGHKVLYISLEMNTQEIYENIARSYSKITIKEEVTKKIPESKKELYNKKMEELNNIKNLKTKGIRGNVEINWDYVKTILDEEKELDLVFIDNLDLIIGNDGEKDYDRQRRISREILAYTAQRQVPIFLLHHYKKRGKSGDLRTLDDISGSAKITHDAHRIVMLFRKKLEEASMKDKASLKLFLMKARGYNQCIKTIYFDKGSFYDEFVERKKNEDFWWNIK